MGFPELIEHVTGVVIGKNRFFRDPVEQYGCFAIDNQPGQVLFVADFLYKLDSFRVIGP